ncbi:T9SS type A sorting domain-containing protein [Edaphocola aurantiacus]|uniref:T9SS type A sorting domain-containing protein n=1 Tax=Edaphocola aurantiacus TaxID=2601682 RepID=UPI001C939688|nr:T9SS type A sorting domain-containing protein [Edaphocola aurantiacus]
MMKQHNTVQSFNINDRATPLCATMTSTNPASSGLRKWLRKSLRLGLLALGLCSAEQQLSAQAPNSLSLLYNPDNLKHYATSQMLNKDEYAMAGTAFDYAGTVGDNAVHLLVFDPAGSPIVSQFYNDPGYDERVKGVHYLNPNDVAIVATRTALPWTPGPSGIEVIRADAANGMQFSTHVIESPFPGQDYWPTGSMLYGNGRIYICGYMTPSMPPGVYPDFSTPKTAFVLIYDIAANMVAAMNTYDWPAGGNDYDIPHRMKIMSSGDIWVGGMCNDGGGGQAMMNLQIDGALNMMKDAPIQQATLTNYLNTSFDFWEDPTNPAVAYVFGNFCFNLNASQMDLFPTFLNVTTIDIGTLMPPAGANNQAWMGQIDYCWGTNIVRGNSNNTLILSGFQSNFACGGQAFPTSQDNVNPYLAELMPITTSSGDIIINTNYWVTIESAAGTGSRSMDPNSYYNLGNAPSNLVWGPVTTVRDNGMLTDDIVLNTPIWNKFTNVLNPKFLRTDKNGDPACKFSMCMPYFPNAQTMSPGNIVSFSGYSWNEYNTMVPDGPLPLSMKLDCSSGYFSDNRSLKPVPNVLAVSVYPNPAQDIISLQFNGTVNDNDAIQVNITDVTGKEATVLYRGTKAAMNSQLKLPQLAKGTYLITVYQNTIKLKSVPVVIK